jgi:ATP-dependent protease ClpP protease subunit
MYITPRHSVMSRINTQYRAAVGDDDSSSGSTVESKDNRVYFYSDVSSEECLKLIRAVREVDIKLRTEHLGRGLDDDHPRTPIWLHIHSYGGELFAGFSIADQLARIKSPIYAVVEGICASAATLIAMSCDRRYIQPSSFMLVHQLWAFAWGTHEQFKDEMTLQNKLMERLVAFYVEKSKVKEDEIRTMLQRDFWMDAETCVKLGFVDDILR